jgi:uncharacterized metal-binding protein (TIGR02443 family)
MKRRQFIAGAICPECQQMDRIVVEQDGELNIRRCVACGFSDSVMPGAGVLPGTRFSRAAEVTEPEVRATPTVVRILATDADAGESADESGGGKKR